MERVKKLFGEIDLSWNKLILFAVISGIYTAIMAILPITNNTSFADITVSFEVWILFGIIIIMNSKSAIDSALKCFVFFLISQPLVYLIQVPFNSLGFGIFIYYKNWFIWTLFTLPMGFIGYYIKKDKWWGVIILIPVLLLLGAMYKTYLGETIMSFPNHVLTTIFCVCTMLLYPIVLFNNKTAKTIGIIVSIVIILGVTVFTLFNRTEYNTTILVSGGSEGVIFDNSYNAYLKDDKYGKVYITYDNNINDYMLNASFIKTGTTEFVLESPDGEKTVFEIVIKNNEYDLTRK